MLKEYFLFLVLFESACAFAPAQSASLPSVEEIAPGIFAEGFQAKFDSATCGWVRLAKETLLIDLPHGVAFPEFLAEVERMTTRPVRSFVLTRSLPSDREAIAALIERGLKRIDLPEQRGLIGDVAEGIEFIPYDKVSRLPGGAIYLSRQKVLFAGPMAINGPRVKLAGSDTAAWISALADLEKLGATTVVPGFGSWSGPGLLERQRLFLADLRQQVGYKISMGYSIERIVREVVIAPALSVWMPYDTPNSEDIRHVYDELTIPAAPFGGQAPRRDDPQPHALVLIGDRFHEPEHIEAGLRPVFETAEVIPHFLVDPKGLTAENLKAIGLLVILRDGYIWPEDKGISWMTPDQQRAVVEFVEHGGAFLNLHNSMGLYPENGPYLQLVGGHYIGHGPLERFRTEVVDPNHPITRGVTDFFTADEQHTPPFETNKVHLLLRNRSDDGKVVAAAGWAYEPGGGRVCHLANGHTREALNHPMFRRLMVNAVNWCLRKDKPSPEN